MEDPKTRQILQDALQLRFSLVGGVFDTIQRNTTVTTDWAILLVQLVSYGVIDLNNNAELFTTVIDMLATLIHSTLVSDSQSDKDENKKHYQNLMKKLKKELGDRNSQSIQFVRQLLPLPKLTTEVITCEPVGCLTDTKGNKIAGFDSIDKKQVNQNDSKYIIEIHKKFYFLWDCVSRAWREFCRTCVGRESEFSSVQSGHSLCLPRRPFL